MRNYLLYFLLSFFPALGFGQILEEGFDDITTLEASGWTSLNLSDSPGLTDWFQGNPDVFSGYQGGATSYIGANFNNTAGSVISNWGITPTVNVKDGDVLSFYTRTTDFTGLVYNDRLEVRMSTGTMTLPSGPTGVGSFTTVMGIINDGYNDSYPHTWTQYSYTVSGVGSTPVAANFAFRYNVTNAGPSGSNSDYIGIDSVLITEDGGGTGGDFPAPYCVVSSYTYVEPITRVIFAGIDNSSSASVDESEVTYHEDFTDIVGNVEAGGTYDFAAEGNTDGASYTNSFTVFIDWNQDYTFNNDDERYEIGTIMGSDGTDGQQAVNTITVPDGAMEGQTRMRVIKKYLAGYAPDGCTSGSLFGQAEDYTINVSDGGTGGDGELLVIDLTTENQVTITATTGASAATASGSTTSGFYFENLFASAGTQAIGATTYVGTPTLTAASVPTDNSPNLFRSVNTDPGMNIWSYSATSPTTFTTGEQAFTGDATWSISPELYNALLTAPATGNVYFPADDVTDLATASLLGTYIVILPDGPPPTGDGCDWTVIVQDDDYFGDEVTWTLKDADGTTLLSGGDYGDGYYDEQTVTAEGPLEFYISAIGFFNDNEPTYSVSNGTEVLVSGQLFGGDEATYSDLNCDGDEPPTGEDCDQGDDSNAFENGHQIGSGTDYENADDFYVSADNTLHVQTIELNAIAMLGPVESIGFTFYEDDGGAPGSTVVTTVPQTVPYDQVLIGSAFGYDVYAIYVDVDLNFEGGTSGTSYWMQPTAVAPGGEIGGYFWEITSLGTLGAASHTRTAGGPWEADPDGADGVFKLHCEHVDPPTPPCTFSITNDIEPITRVVLSDIDHTSDATVNGSPALEDFTSVEGHVSAGESYDVALEGNTAGAFTTYFTVFIDWNQDGDLTDAGEMYEIGSITSSTGTDGQQATGSVSVPSDAMEGSTLMRVIKNYNSSPTNPCGTYGWGQAEDYTIVVGDGPVGPEDCSQSFAGESNTGVGFINNGTDIYVAANDINVPANTQFNVETITFDVVSLSGAPTLFDLSFYSDNGGVDQQIGSTQSAITPSNITPNGTFGANNYPVFTVELTLAAPQLLQATATDDVKYWIAISGYPSEEAANVYWVSYLYTDNDDSEPSWQSPDAGATWAEFANGNGEPVEGVMTVAGQCEQLGISDMSSFDFAYYPNPVKDVLNMSSGKTIENVSAYNLAGQRVLQSAKVTDGQVNVSSLPTGVYVFRVTLQGGQIETFKIVKK